LAKENGKERKFLITYLVERIEENWKKPTQSYATTRTQRPYMHRKARIAPRKITVPQRVNLNNLWSGDNDERQDILRDWWEMHWLSDAINYQDVMFTTIGSVDEDLEEFVTSVSEEICVVFSVKTSKGYTISDVIIPWLYFKYKSFFDKAPVLEYNSTTFTYDNNSRNYLKTLKKLIKSYSSYPVFFCDDETRSHIDVELFISDLGETNLIEHPTKNNPELVQAVEGRIKLVEFLDSNFKIDSLEILQKAEHSSCICSDKWLKSRKPTSMLDSLNKNFIGNVDGIQTQHQTLNECITDNARAVYQFISENKVSKWEYFTENGRKYDRMSFFWCLLLGFSNANFAKKLARIEGLFCFFKLQIYAWKESELLALISSRKLNILSRSDTEDMNYQLTQRDEPLGIITETPSEIFLELRSKNGLAQKRQEPVFMYLTKFEDYSYAEKSYVDLLFSDQFPGYLLTDYTSVPVYLSCCTRNFIQQRILKFNRSVISNVLNVFCEEKIEEMRASEPVQYKKLTNSEKRFSKKNYLSRSRVSRERIESITSDELAMLRKKMSLLCSQKLDSIHEDFYERIYSSFFKDSLISTSRSKTNHTTANRAVTHLWDITKDVVRAEPYVNDVFEVKYGIKTDQQSKDNVFDTLKTENAEIINKVCYQENVESYTKELCYNVDITLPPCVSVMIDRIHTDKTHPKYDERFFLVCFFRDLGLHPLLVLDIYRTLFVDIPDINKSNEAFLRSKTYGAEFVNIIERTARISLSSTIQNPVVGWSCCTIMSKSFCPIDLDDSVVDIEDLADKTCSCNSSSNLHIKKQRACYDIAKQLSQEHHPETRRINETSTGYIKHPIRYVSLLRNPFFE
jgi:hypothetical protein